ncbi:hypothetical protein ACOSQ2_001670 [Xanthoceras sorbifolium]
MDAPWRVTSCSCSWFISGQIIGDLSGPNWYLLTQPHHRCLLKSPDRKTEDEKIGY